jgi:hypothetical protein
LTQLDENRGDEVAVRGIAGSLGGLLVEITKEAVQAWSRARARGVRILHVGKTEAQSIHVPPGHPGEGVLSIGHPALANVYDTTAAFHRVPFEQKFCEAIELLMHLGASTIRVEHVRGWSQAFSTRLSVRLGPTESVAAEVGRQQSKKEQLLYDATLTGTK